MEGSSLQTGDYKAEVKRLGLAWGNMSEEQREAYIIQAKHENLQRSELSELPLPAKGEGKSELELQVGRSGCKKISMKRLEANEKAFMEHQSWSHPTQLGDGCLESTMNYLMLMWKVTHNFCLLVPGILAVTICVSWSVAT
jgi:hypothetical protein